MEIKVHPFCNEPPRLPVDRFDKLHSGGNIRIDVINEGKDLLELGFCQSQAQVPGLLIPLNGPNGKPYENCHELYALHQ
jgi:hypothetical protein